MMTISSSPSVHQMPLYEDVGKLLDTPGVWWQLVPHHLFIKCYCMKMYVSSWRHLVYDDNWCLTICSSNATGVNRNMVCHNGIRHKAVKKNCWLLMEKHTNSRLSFIRHDKTALQQKSVDNPNFNRNIK